MHDKNLKNESANKKMMIMKEYLLNIMQNYNIAIKII